MNNKNQQGEGTRIQNRKRKTLERILNVSISVVVVLILITGGKLIFGGKSSKPVTSNEIEQTEIAVVEEKNEENDTNMEEIEEVTDDIEVDQEYDPQDIAPPDEYMFFDEGDWGPIGTVQQEPFVAVYEKSHVNWQEMTYALQYATNLWDGMTIWRLGNGGSPQSAVGVVSDYSTRSTPYQVRLQWVPNEGWMPVSVEILDSNPYLRN